MTIVHVSPSNLSSWDELRKADDDSPPWVNPESFKKSILGIYEPNVKAAAGNACHDYVFSGEKTREDIAIVDGKTVHWNFNVDDRILGLREWFDFGLGVPEVPALIYLDEQIDGCTVRINGRCDYLSKNLITELKTSSRSFSKKGTTRAYLESQQANCYMMRYGIPIRFLFAEIDIKESLSGVLMITTKNISCSTQYPSDRARESVLESVSSLIPYLRQDEKMWARVTGRTEPEVL